MISEGNLELEGLLSRAWRLRFPKEQEKSFQDYHYHKTILNARAAVGLSLVLNTVFIFFDDRTLSVSRNYIYLIRYAIIGPLVLLGLVLLFLPFFKRLMQLILSAIGVLIGLAAILIVALVQPQEPGYMLNQIVLILTIVAMYNFLQLKFFYATLIGWLNVINYVIVAGFIQDGLSEPKMTFFLSNVFFCIIANILGMFGAYSIELYQRRDFVQRQLIEREQNKAERLLLNILPEEIAATLKETPRTIADQYHNVSILFADVVNFTPLSARLAPTELVELLNEMFSHFDTLVEKHRLEKIKTIGDCYMVAAGVPRMRPDHAQALARLALEMQQYVAERTFLDGLHLELRMGINSGPVVAGVIGHKKFSYDLWGDTVNIASRMESQGVMGRIQITRATYELLKAEFNCQPAGKIKAKGRGELEVWHLLSEAGALESQELARCENSPAPPLGMSLLQIKSRPAKVIS
jgi:guanylate cyclase